VGLCAHLPWLVAQREESLLFYSWPVEPSALSARIPAQLELERFDGRAWVTLIPFRMRGLHARWLPPVPGTSSFDEVDCLTCVRHGDQPGIWFFRIEASSRVMAWSARTFFGLPYVHAPVRVESDGDGWRCTVDDGSAGPHLDLSYQGVGPTFEARPGTLAHFVVERFVMYSTPRHGTLLWGREARRPRRIRDAEVHGRVDQIAAAAGVPAPTGEVATWTCETSSIRTWLSVPVPPTSPGR